MSPKSLLFITIGGTLSALDKETGSLLWEAPIPLHRSQLSADEERVYIVSQSSELIIVHAKDGSIFCRQPLSGTGQSPTLLVEEDRLYVSCGGVVQAFTLEGMPLWTNSFDGKGNGSINMATTTRDRQADEY